jgi:hypothetical protein
MPYVRNKSVSVDITNGPKGLEFALNENNGNGRVHEVIFKNEKHPGLIVYFNIRDIAKSGLKFQPVPADALWVNPPTGPTAPAPACPNRAMAWPGFVPLSVEDDKDGNTDVQLIAYFRNGNENKGKCKFILRFVDTTGAPVDYDPIGDGNNGPRL